MRCVRIVRDVGAGLKWGGRVGTGARALLESSGSGRPDQHILLVAEGFDGVEA